jgi:hypothetical protein
MNLRPLREPKNALTVIFAGCGAPLRLRFRPQREKDNKSLAARASPVENREQLARPASSHKIIQLLLRTGEFFKSLHVDHYHGERVQSLGFVDRKE